MDNAKKNSHTAAAKRYNATHMSRMELCISKADMAMLEQLAAYAGQSRTAYIMQAVRERAERDDAPVGRL